MFYVDPNFLPKDAWDCICGAADLVPSVDGKWGCAAEGRMCPEAVRRLRKHQLKEAMKADLSIRLAEEITRRVWPDSVGPPANKGMPLLVEEGTFKMKGTVADIGDLERVLNKTWQLQSLGRIATATLWLQAMTLALNPKTGLSHVSVRVKWTAR